MKTLTFPKAGALLLALCCVSDGFAAMVDRSFRPGTGIDGGDETAASVVLLLANGKILVGGDFDTYNGIVRPNLVRLHTNGSLDQSLHLVDGVSQLEESPAIKAAGLQPNGKIIVSGRFWTISGVARPGLARLHPDGTLDTAWVPQFRGVHRAQKTIVLHDGRILAWNSGGQFAAGVIERLNADGSSDTNFNVTVVAGRFVPLWGVSLQADGRILLSGSFEEVNGIPSQNVARLHADGSVDTSFRAGQFGPGPVGSTVYGAREMPDGRIVVYGYFVSVDRRPRPGLALLRSNGRLDTTARFPVTRGYVLQAVLQAQPLSDGSIVAYSVDESSSWPTPREVTVFTERPLRQRLKGRPWRVEFTVSPNGGVYGIAEDSRGRLLIAGEFWELNGVRVPTGITRLVRRGHRLPYR